MQVFANSPDAHHYPCPRCPRIARYVLARKQMSVSVGDIVAPGFEKIVGLASTRRHGDLIKKSKELIAAVEKGEFALPSSGEAISAPV